MVRRKRVLVVDGERLSGEVTPVVTRATGVVPKSWAVGFIGKAPKGLPYGWWRDRSELKLSFRHEGKLRHGRAVLQSGQYPDNGPPELMFVGIGALRTSR